MRDHIQILTLLSRERLWRDVNQVLQRKRKVIRQLSKVSRSNEEAARVAELRDELQHWRNLRRTLHTTSNLPDYPGFALAGPDLVPVTAPNQWLRTLWEDGTTSSWHTLRKYAYDLGDYFDYLVGKCSWQDINHNLLVSYRYELEQRGLTASTIQARLIAVGRFYRFATHQWFIRKNPVKYESVESNVPENTEFVGIRTKKRREIPTVAYDHPTRRERRHAVPRFIEHETVLDLLEAIPSERDRLIVRVLYESGIRRSECAAIKITDLPTRTEVESQKQNSRLAKRCEFDVVGKGNCIRSVGIGWPLFFAIDRWRQRERAAILRKHQIDKEQDHGYLFVNQYGRPIQPVTLNHIFNRMSERVGFRVTPHMLRHSFAVTKRRFDEAAGVRQSLRGVQLELGHRGLDTTEKYYDHLSSAEKALEDASNQTRYDLSRPRKKDEKKAKK